MRKLDCPLIYVSDKGVSAYATVECASVVGLPFLDEQWWKERQLIDASGTVYEISDAQVLGNASWWPHSLTKRDRRIFKVNYSLRPIDHFDLDEVKATVVDRLRKSNEAWAFVDECSSIEDIAESLGMER